MSRPVWSNIKGTSSTSFTIGIGGATIFQGQNAPDQLLGNIGDIYVLKNNSPNLLQKTAQGWVELEGRFLRQEVTQGSTATVSVTATYVGILPGSGNTTITLPTPWEGREVVIKHEGAGGTTTIVGTIDGQTNMTLTGLYSSISLVWSGEWSVFRKIS